MRSRAIVTLIGLALLLAACSSGSDGSSAASPSSTKAPVDAADVAARPSAGCRGATPVAAGEVKVDTTSGGQPRWYYRNVPSSYAGTTPMPVVLDLHGYAEGATVHTKMSALGPFGDTHGFITITPQGTGKVARWDTQPDSADVKYIVDLLDEVDNTLCVDQNRVFATGYSNGAFLTSELACSHADRIAAAAPVAGIRAIKGCKPARPVPVIAFHGTADGFVDYNGGLGKEAAKLPAPDGSGKSIGESGVVPRQTKKNPTIPENAAAWAKRNGCSGTQSDTTVATDVTLIAFTCPAGDEVELYSIADGGHTWPGSAFSQVIASVTGRTTMSIDANELIWKFFQAHPLRNR